jgi:hypothetical protein
MIINSNFLTGFIVFILIFIIISSGCSSSNSLQPKVIIEGKYQASGLALLSNPIITDVQVVATNVGDVDARNVETIIQMTYLGKLVGEEKVYFGTVKVGIPVTKDTIIKVNIPSGNWSNFDTNKLDMEIKTIIIDGSVVGSVTP